MKILTGLLASLVFVTGALAQVTELKVPFGSASFVWDIPAPDATHGPATKHVLTCGSIIVEIPMPANSIPVKSVVPSPGQYTCTLFAANDFGRQADPNVPFPVFEAGNRPNKPAQLRLEAQ